jgi:methylthioribulose-1-phosphate dehydratase
MPSPSLPPPPFDSSLDAIDQLRSVGREFHGRGWSLGTSSNYSVVSTRAPLELTITVSGKDKSALGRDDFVRVNAAGAPCDGSGRKSSAETLLHCLIAELVPSVGAVLHTHSVWSTILSRADLPRGAVRIEGYEMLKGLDGIVTHDTFEEVPIFANAQDMEELAARIRARFAAADWSDPKRPPFHGFLLSGHGLYTWGRDLAEARRQIEIHEFLFEVVARTRTFAGTGVATAPIAPAAAGQSQSIQPQSIQVGTERTVPAAARQQQTAQHQQ